MEDAITTERLTKYFGRRRVVDSLNLRVPRGSVYGLLGRNGAGKSTTIKMLMGLLAPDSGEARLLGEESSCLPPETKGRISYLAENQPLYGWMTVDEIVHFTQQFYRTWNAAIINEVCDYFGLPRRQKLRRLSHGQRAQVALALAIAPDPELLILDDPTLGLDTVVRREFLEAIIQLIQRDGRTILFSSHILGDVERVADRIGVLVNGVLRVDCPTEDFKSAVKKVVCEFDGAVPPVPDDKGLVHSRQLGSRLELIFVHFRDSHRQLIESLRPTHWEVVDLNLEDAFIEYTRSERSLLPTFTGEPNHVASVSN